MTEIKNIIFDWDNTLFPFKEKYWESAHRKLFSEDFQFSESELERFMSLYHEFDELLWPQVHERKMLIEKFREERLRLTLEAFDLEFEDAYIKGFFKRFLTTLHHQIEPDENLNGQLEKLAQGHKLAILTNGGRVEQREKLRRAGLEERFPLYISGETGFLKPDPRAFKTVLERENFVAQETLMVGDLLEHDIAPARKLGLKTAYIGPEKETIADFEFNQIQDFFDFWRNKN
ncbi:HAD family hydrolase [Lactococcus kimchii]|uniref:HAD family hydrolase n=1 Tax=Lactococcus sp. S-13 TaxID=2507158 RepID=UPI0010234749|nr:HAD family hydrolase [Lactococcus sp. S-13]RZI49041.1 HAD family hydrolase [Lactococcus sp. S-13]